MPFYQRTFISGRLRPLAAEKASKGFDATVLIPCIIRIIAPVCERGCLQGPGTFGAGNFNDCTFRRRELRHTRVFGCDMPNFRSPHIPSSCAAQARRMNCSPPRQLLGSTLWVLSIATRLPGLSAWEPAKTTNVRLVVPRDLFMPNLH